MNHQLSALPPLPIAPPDIQQLIQKLERRHLDNAAPPAQPVWGAKIENVPYWRVLGQARFWEDVHGESLNYENHMEDLITGFHGQGMNFAFLVLGSRQSLEIYLGLQGGGGVDLLPAALQGTFPGIQLASQPDTHLGSARKDSGIFNLMGRLTGIPTRKSGEKAANADDRSPRGGRVQQIERLLRALHGEEWGYLVWGSPVLDATTVQTTQQRLSEMTKVSTRVQLSENAQVTFTKTPRPNESEAMSTSRSANVTNRWAAYATELLEHDFGRYRMGQAQGMWQTEVYFFASRQETLAKTKALLRAIYAGEDSSPEPLRTFVGERGGQEDAADFMTTLTSGEVATLCQLPREEFPGYQVSDYARFDVDIPIPEKDAIAIGKVLDRGSHTGGWFTIPRADIAKHGLVVGVTGSGKTNTMFHLLDKLWGAKIPFLVLEPAKTEYRDLLRRGEFQAHLRIYTLGDERFAPFRINLFAFEIATAENRIHVQTHIDFLKSVFNAAFILYAPMPYVLETCLHEIYEDKGWDLTSSQNRRLPPAERGKEHNWPVFPTLTDLYNKIEEVVDRLGYEERITRDVKAGLKARVGSLRLGGKGLMLDTRQGISMTELLSRPTVLELERIGNDDEKAFVIGLILTRLYEYRIVQAKSGANLPALQHVTVFEEAHRLLKNTRTEVGSEEANTKAQAVEAFANMLSEIRAYGQGVLIAEQIPTKLAPDAIKNTNLKIMHRMVAADDRQVMGGTMNLDEVQLRIVAALRAGQAAVFAEGADGPSLIQVVRQPEKDAGQPRKRVSDAEIKKAMTAVCGGPVYEPVPGYSNHLKLGAEQLTLVHDLAQDVLEHPEFTEQFSRYFLSLVMQPEQAVNAFHQLLDYIERVVGKLKLEKEVAVAVLLQALDALFGERGRHYRWFYNVSVTLRDQLAAPLAQIARGYQNKRQVLDQLAAQTRPALDSFIVAYKDQTGFKQRPGPFAGCIYCPERCLYRWDVAPLLRDETLERDFVRAIQNTQDDQAMWQGLASVAKAAAGRVLAVGDEALKTGPAICFVAQMTAGLGFSALSQRKAGQNVKMLLE